MAKFVKHIIEYRENYYDTVLGYISENWNINKNKLSWPNIIMVKSQGLKIKQSRKLIEFNR